MPELPEVETTLRGIKPHLLNQTVSHVVIRHPKLRWAIPADLNDTLKNQTVNAMRRRGKYILLDFANGTLILHLGMSGKLRVLKKHEEPRKHDHVDICFKNKVYLRFSDPRRFGALLFTSDLAEHHPLLANIGVEPLTKSFHGEFLFSKSLNKKAPVKSFIMDSSVVCGVGNIYATEALFAVKLAPLTPAGKISLAKYEELALAIKKILTLAITKGGTTLKDFMQSDGKPGYFSIKLKVYGKDGTPCPRCGTLLKNQRIAQRSTVYCSKCQK